jgi:hypothetical protein
VTPGTADGCSEPNVAAFPLFVAVRDFAPSGIPRRLGFRAVWDFAPFGIWRRSRPAPFPLGRRPAYADAYSNGPTAMYWPE